MKRLLAIPLILFGATLSTLLFSAPASAVTGADFRPGRIMDDAIFYNKGSMSAAQIQQFLDSKVACDTWGTKPSEFGGGTRAQYGTANGNPPPYICLESYHENPTTHENNLDGRPIPAGGISAAQIFWNVSQEFNINPQVLIVLVQKEQGLVTDQWPWRSQYRKATGFGCPDSASSCDQQYNGFYNQVYHAARQFRIYANNPTGFNHIAKQNNLVRWSPNQACGSGLVYIENQATASLYNYTPYQPNAAALNNLYGMGDGCSAYGNRNFWRYFNDWFGPTLVPNYGWQIASLSTTKNHANLPATEKARLTIKARNIGLLTWQRDGAHPVRLGTDGPQDRVSTFCDTTWLSCSRIARLIEPSVAPGQIGTFEFDIQAPNQTGQYSEKIRLLAENYAWMDGQDVALEFTVSDPEFSFSVPTNNLPSFMQSGDDVTVSQKLRNEGNVSWYKTGRNPIHMGTANPPDRTSPFYDTSWLNQARVAALQEQSVGPGQTGTFVFKLKAPTTIGTLTETFSLVSEGREWFSETLSKDITTVGTYQPAFTSNQAVTVVADSTSTITVTARNDGTATWRKSDGDASIKLSLLPRVGGENPLCYQWVDCQTPAELKEDTVAPGQTGTFEFKVKPKTSLVGQQKIALGLYSARFGAVGSPTTLNIEVQAPRYTWSLVAQQVFTDDSKTYAMAPNIKLAHGQKAFVTIRALNTGNVPWHKSGENVVRLGTDGPRDRMSGFCDSTWIKCNRAATLDEDVILPGEIGTFKFWTHIGNHTGGFKEYFTPLIEGKSWLNNIGMYFTYQVGPPIYTWGLTSQKAFTDTSKTVPLNGLITIQSGQTAYLEIVALNTGNTIWNQTGNNALHIAGSRPNDRQSAFCDPSWPSCNRSARLVEGAVPPGGTGTFRFYVKAPANAVTSNEYFTPVIEGKSWLNDIGLYYTLRSQP